MGIFDKFVDYTFHPIDTATDVFKKSYWSTKVIKKLKNKNNY